jgi:hypothetical protein
VDLLDLLQLARQRKMSTYRSQYQSPNHFDRTQLFDLFVFLVPVYITHYH